MAELPIERSVEHWEGGCEQQDRAAGSQDLLRRAQKLPVILNVFENIYGHDSVNVTEGQIMLKARFDASYPRVPGKASVQKWKQILCRLQHRQLSNGVEVEQIAGKRPDSGPYFGDTSADVGAEEASESPDSNSVLQRGSPVLFRCSRSYSSQECRG